MASTPDPPSPLAPVTELLNTTLPAISNSSNQTISNSSSSTRNVKKTNHGNADGGGGGDGRAGSSSSSVSSAGKSDASASGIRMKGAWSQVVRGQPSSESEAVLAKAAAVSSASGPVPTNPNSDATSPKKLNSVSANPASASNLSSLAASTSLVAPASAKKQMEKQDVGSSPETTGGGVDPPDRSDTAVSPETNLKAAKPAWRKPVDGGGKISAAEPVMGALSWPALADARSLKYSDASKPTNTPLMIEDPPIQGSGAGTSLHAKGGGSNGSNPATSSRHKATPKRNATATGMHAKFAQSSAAPTSRLDTALPPTLLHSVTEALPLVQGGVDIGVKVAAGRGSNNDRASNSEHGSSFRQRSDGTGPFFNNNANRRNNMREHGRGNHGWYHNRGYANGRDNGMAFQQQRVGPRNLPRPPPPAYIGANPGFINAPSFQNAGGGMYFLSAPAPDPLHSAAYFASHVPPVLIPAPDPTIALRAKLAKQVEYYFSVGNLCKDIFLRSFMDAEGFVPVLVIASFNRVKQLTSNPELILDALRNSTVIEVQGNKLRKRGDWVTWILPANHHDSASSTYVAAGKGDVDKSSGHMMMTDLGHFPQKKRENDMHGQNNGAFVRDSNMKKTPIEGIQGMNYMNTSTESAHELSSNVEFGFHLRKSEESERDIAAIGTDGSNLNTRSSGAAMHTELNPSFIQVEVATRDIKGSSGEQFSSSPVTLSHSVGSGSNQTVGQKAGSLPAEFTCRNSVHSGSEDTFQLDEELESEHSISGNEYEDYSELNDCDVQHLVIVTQRGNASKDHREGQDWRKSITDELATVINDGLNFYEQELRRSKNNQSFGDVQADLTNMRSVAASFGSSSGGGSEGHSHGRTQGQPNKNGGGVMHTTHQQRLFLNLQDASLCGHHSMGAESLPSDAVGFLFASIPPDSQSVVSDSNPPVGSMPKSFPHFQHPSHILLEENGFKQQTYIKFHERCLAERKKLGAGCSEEMNTLFCFWSLFLQSYFNLSMYKEFCQLAEEDAAAKCNYGMECLFRFYSYGLEKKFRQALYEDFEKLTLESYKKGNLYGLQKFWAFHFYRKEDYKPLKMHPELERLLTEEFPALEDFQYAMGKLAKENSEKHGACCSAANVDQAEVEVSSLQPTSESTILSTHSSAVTINKTAAASITVS